MQNLFLFTKLRGLQGHKMENENREKAPKGKNVNEEVTRRSEREGEREKHAHDLYGGETFVGIRQDEDESCLTRLNKTFIEVLMTNGNFTEGMV